jgi:hypothetical protein
MTADMEKAHQALGAAALAWDNAHSYWHAELHRPPNGEERDIEKPFALIMSAEEQLRDAIRETLLAASVDIEARKKRTAERLVALLAEAKAIAEEIAAKNDSNDGLRERAHIRATYASQDIKEALRWASLLAEDDGTPRLEVVNGGR